MSRRTVINAESGRHAIGIDNLIDLARALVVTAAALLMAAEPEDDTGGAVRS